MQNYTVVGRQGLLKHCQENPPMLCYLKSYESFINLPIGAKWNIDSHAGCRGDFPGSKYAGQRVRFNPGLASIWFRQRSVYIGDIHACLHPAQLQPRGTNVGLFVYDILAGGDGPCLVSEGAFHRIGATRRTGSGMPALQLGAAQPGLAGGNHTMDQFTGWHRVAAAANHLLIRCGISFFAAGDRALLICGADVGQRSGQFLAIAETFSRQSTGKDSSPALDPMGTDAGCAILSI